MNNNNLLDSIKIDISTILKTNDLISIKEILERNYNSLSNENINTFFDFIELNLFQEIEEKQISIKTFVKQHNAYPLNQLAERQKRKLKFVEKWIKDKKENLKVTIQPEAIDLSDTTTTEKKVKDLTIQKWFKTGIALATGEAFEIYKKIGNLPTEICRKIGVPESNKTYISATINNLPNKDKNIFNSDDKLKALYKYITENNLKFGTDFLEKYNQIEPD